MAKETVKKTAQKTTKKEATKTTKTYTAFETVVCTSAMNLVGLKKTKEGKLIYLDPKDKTKMVLKVAIPGNQEGDVQSKFIELIVNVEQAKALKANGLDISGKGFVRVKYSIQETYKENEYGYKDVVGFWRHLVDFQLYEDGNWTDWLLHPHKEEAQEDAEEETTDEEDLDPSNFDVEIDEDELPF